MTNPEHDGDDSEIGRYLPQPGDQPPEEAIEVAIEEASHVLCAKSKRGCSIYWESPYGGLISIVGAGHNGPPKELRCDRSEECKANCAKYCQHAEARAINDLLVLCASTQDPFPSFSQPPFSDMNLVHVKVVDGELVKGGGPSCWQCSRQILDLGFGGVWLFEDPAGWVWYDSLTFHLSTLTHERNNIPVKLNPLAR